LVNEAVKIEKAVNIRPNCDIHRLVFETRCSCPICLLVQKIYWTCDAACDVKTMQSVDNTEDDWDRKQRSGRPKRTRRGTCKEDLQALGIMGD